MHTDPFLDDLDRRWLRIHRLWYVATGALFLLSLLTLQPLLFLAALLALMIGFVPAWWYRSALRHLVVRQQMQSPRLFLGDETIFEVSIENQKFFPLPWLACEIPIRPLLPIITQGFARSETLGQIDNSNILWPLQRLTRRYRLRCAARGLYTFGPLNLSNADPFGWIKRQATLPLLDTLLVYPLLVSMDTLGLTSQILFGEKVSAHPLFEDPIHVIGVRDYQIGDDPRRIHWKATARSGSLRSKIYEYDNQRRLLLLLDTGDESTALLKISREMHEFTIAVAASLAVSALDEGYQVGAIFNCAYLTSSEEVSAHHTEEAGRFRLPSALKRVEMSSPGMTVPFARGLGHDERLLATFARLVPAVSVSMDQIIEQEEALFFSGTRIILVTASRVLAQATLARLLEICDPRSSIQIVITDKRENEQGSEISAIPVHYLGGREQWYALVQSFVHERHEESSVQLQLD